MTGDHRRVNVKLIQVPTSSDRKHDVVIFLAFDAVLSRKRSIRLEKLNCRNKLLIIKSEVLPNRSRRGIERTRIASIERHPPLDLWGNGHQAAPHNRIDHINRFGVSRALERAAKLVPTYFVGFLVYRITLYSQSLEQPCVVRFAQRAINWFDDILEEDQKDIFLVPKSVADNGEKLVISLLRSQAQAEEGEVTWPKKTASAPASSKIRF